MPGLVGFSCGPLERPACVAALDAMKALVTYRDFYGIDEAFCDGVVCASRAHTRIFQPEPQPARRGEVYVWLEGEFLNREELCTRHSVSAATDPDLLAVLYTRAHDFSFLRDVDGFFAAVIYDAARGLLHLVPDRYGFRHLYWSDRGGRIAWASELKAFLHVPGFALSIDADSVERFFTAGYFTGDRTWLDGVEVVPGGTVLTWDLAGGAREATRYWSYEEIHVMDPLPDEDEVIEEWGRLFADSVARCARRGRVGVLLSGGLDSRAIVAALPRSLDPAHLVTFGQEGSDDVEIARRVARLRGADHHVMLIDERSWLRDRFEGVWWTDGQLNLIDLHSKFTLEPRRAWFDINISGFIGDVTMGGSFLRGSRESEFAAMRNRFRRFTSVGLRMSQPLSESRLPYVANDLLEFSFSIPSALRKNHYIFNRMLLRAYPDYYRTIPWQKTGVPITWPHRLSNAAHYWGKATDRVKTRLRLPGVMPRRRMHFGSYDLWMRREPARALFDAILTNPDALYPSYLEGVDVPGLWRRHLAGERLGSRVGLYVTFEVWLQQLFNATHREGPPPGSPAPEPPG